MGWDGMGWDGMGWDGMGGDQPSPASVGFGGAQSESGEQTGHHFFPPDLRRSARQTDRQITQITTSQCTPNTLSHTPLVLELILARLLCVDRQSPEGEEEDPTTPTAGAAPTLPPRKTPSKAAADPKKPAAAAAGAAGAKKPPPVKPAQFCSSCGSKRPPESKFCAQCGSKF
jgi:hypothetical protein